MDKEAMIAEVRNYMIENMDGKIDSTAMGIRYDDKKVVEGEILENSISNIGGEYDRDFPMYDETADRLSGTCIFAITFDLDYMDSESEVDEAINKCDYFFEGSEETSFKHCSIVMGNGAVNTVDAEMEGEAIVENCTVVKVLF